MKDAVAIPIGCSLLLLVFAVCDFAVAGLSWLIYRGICAATNQPANLSYWVFCLIALPFILLLVSVKITINTESRA